MDFGTADTSIYRIGNLIVRWTEIYVPETIYLVLISATINFAQRFAAFLVTCTVRVNVYSSLLLLLSYHPPEQRVALRQSTVTG